MRNFARNAAMLLVLVLGVILLGSGCTTTSGPAQGIVTGTVTDTANNADSLSGVEVSIGTSTTTTDADGVYTLRDVPVGKKTLTAEKDGYTNYSSEVNVRDGETTTHDFTMSPVAPDTGSVTGTVLYTATGDPVEGVVVTVGGVDGTTDEEGTYEINGVAPGADQELAAVDEQDPKRYQDYCGTVTVTVDETTDYDFEMLPAPGRNAVFVSEATNLDVNYDPTPQPALINYQVYYKDLITGETFIVSKDPQDTGGEGEERFGADAACWYPDVSADGRYVVFYSNAINLTDDEVNGQSKIFLYNRRENTMANLTPDVDEGCYSPRISADGRYIAFSTQASNLPGVVNPDEESVIVRYCVEDGAFYQVTPYDEGAETAGSSYTPTISADGRFITFESDSPNLIEELTPESSQIFLCDCDATENRFTLVSHAQGEPDEEGNGECDAPAISADGRYITFASFAADLTDDPPGTMCGWRSNVFCYDVESGNNVLITRSAVGNGEADQDSFNPNVSADGRFIAFSSNATDLVEPGVTAFRGHIYLYDRTEETMTLVSHNYDNDDEADSQSDWAAIAPDGSYVIYQSYASDLVSTPEAPYPDTPQVFLFARELNINSMVSVSPDGEPGEGESYSPNYQ